MAKAIARSLSVSRWATKAARAETELAGCELTLKRGGDQRSYLSPRSWQ
ncbi:MAG: hypothetical protein ABR511_00880 [Acidimicrobiales bacterium]